MTQVIYYPRASVQLHAVVLGEAVTTTIVPARATITRRAHNQAGTCEIEIHGSALPFEPRTLEDLFLSVSFGTVPTMDGRLGPEDLQFIGYADKVEPTRSDKAPVVKIAARDLSAVLRDTKNLPAAVMPRYADTLRQAIDRVVVATLDRLTGDADLEERELFLTVRETPEADRPLGALVAARARAHPIPVKNDPTAWEIIEHAAALVSCQVFVDLDEIVVVDGSSQDAGLGEPAARFVFGSAAGNVLSVEMVKKFQRNRKGIRVVAYDSATRRTIEADYPPDSQLPPRRRARPSTGRRGGGRGGRRRTAAPASQPPQRDIFNVGGVTSHAQLQSIAEQIWNQRARQELEVSVETPELTPAFLSLTNRDRVQIQVSPDVAAEVRRLDEASAVRFLVRRLGVVEEAARVLVRAARAVLPDRFYVRTATLSWEAGGKSTVKVEAVNLIHVEPGR